MSHLSKIFTKIPVDIPNRSGFDMSHENTGTIKPGILYPVLCEEVSPNETYSLGHAMQCQLAPVVSNFFGRIDVRLEAFFVPNRILWAGWQNFWTMPENNPYGNSVLRPTVVPYYKKFTKDFVVARNTLLDFIGIKGSSSDKSYGVINILPFLAYHKIWDDFYRNTKIQNPAFVNVSGTGLMPPDELPPYILPWKIGISDNSNTVTPRVTTPLMADGVDLFAFRSRNWAKDYFTTCSLFPQSNGSVTGSSIVMPVSDNQTSISIGAIRSANVLQRWMERNNICGERYADQVKGQYGVYPSDAFLDRPIFLGSDIINVYNRSIFGSNQAQQSGAPVQSQFGFAGSNSSAFKDGKLIDSFRSSEHGYIMVLASLVPHAYYATGIRRQLLHRQQGDFPIPLLQGLGEQPVYKCELSPDGNMDSLIVFGYQQQYAEIKYHDDEVHGLLVDGENLSFLQLQRSFNETVSLTSDFLQISEDSLDNVLVTKVSESGFAAWYDIFLALKKVSPFSEYVIPTLGDLKNTHKETVDYRGKQL